MKEKILNKSCDMFLSLGFKSVTMDDIAKEIGASKKTIYQHFKNKIALVKEVTDTLFCSICDGIDLIHEQENNPIVELFEIKRFLMEHLKNEKSSPQFQLQKYYPKIFASIKKRQFDYMQKSIRENLERGLEQGLYRKSINIDFISRLYFNGLIGIKDQELFPLAQFTQKEVADNYLEYHLRGICTEKGILEIENQLKSN